MRQQVVLGDTEDEVAGAGDHQLTRTVLQHHSLRQPVVTVGDGVDERLADGGSRDRLELLLHPAGERHRGRLVDGVDVTKTFRQGDEQRRAVPVRRSRERSTGRLLAQVLQRRVGYDSLSAEEKRSRTQQATLVVDDAALAEQVRRESAARRRLCSSPAWCSSRRASSIAVSEMFSTSCSVGSADSRSCVVPRGRAPLARGPWVSSSCRCAGGACRRRGRGRRPARHPG